MIRTALVALVLATATACGDVTNGRNAGSPSDDHGPKFGDFGYSDIYRYYGGPSAVVQEFDAQERRKRQSRPD